jgi:chromosome segregation ATPase
MPPKRGRGQIKTIPSVDYKTESELRERNLIAEKERKEKEAIQIQESQKKELQKLKEVKEDNEQVKSDVAQVINDITREYKVQQNTFKKKVDELNKEVAELEKQLADTRMKIRHTKENFDREKAAKDETIQKNIMKSEQMAQEFRDMLKGTLVKMSDRIEMSRESDENQPLSESGTTSTEQLIESH